MSSVDPGTGTSQREDGGPSAPSPSPAGGLEGQDVAHAGARVSIAGLAAFLFAVPFALLVMLITSESEFVERLDRRASDVLHELVSGHETATTALEVIGRVLDPWVLRAGALLLAVALLVRGRRRAAFWLTLTVAIGGLVGLGLKLVVQRARPVFEEPVYVASGYSFPSGHALNSVVIVLAVLIVLWPGLSRSPRVVAGTGAALLVLVVGLDRVALGVHFPTDVVGGWIVGVAVVAAAGVALVTPESVSAARTSSGTGASISWPRALGHMLGRLIVGWLAILTLMVALGLLVTRVADDRWPLTGEERLSASLEQARTSTWNTATLLMRHLGDTPIIIGVMLVVALLLRAVLGRWREGLFVIAAVSGQAVVFISTTALVERERPEVEQLDSSPPTSSFPSGHTGAALALYMAIAVTAIRAVRPRWARYLIAGLCLIPPLLVGFARLYRGMHHPSDLAGAIVNASLCLWLAARVVLDGTLPEGDSRQRSDSGAGGLSHAQRTDHSTVAGPGGAFRDPSHDERIRAGASP